MSPAEIKKLRDLAQAALALPADAGIAAEDAAMKALHDWLPADTVLELIALVERQEAELERRQRARFILSQVVHNMVVANQASWIEWKHGSGAEAAMLWIENGLAGPGHIPTGTDAQTYFDANYDDRMEPDGGFSAVTPQAQPALMDAPNDGRALNIAREALQFYADREHFHLHEPDAWSTMIGKPKSIYYDEHGTTAIETGYRAQRALKEIANATGSAQCAAPDERKPALSMFATMDDYREELTAWQACASLAPAQPVAAQVHQWRCAEPENQPWHDVDAGYMCQHKAPLYETRTLYTAPPPAPVAAPLRLVDGDPHEEGRHTIVGTLPRKHTFGPPRAPAGEPYFVGMLNSQYAIVGRTADGRDVDLRVIGDGAKDGKTKLLVELPALAVAEGWKPIETAPSDKMLLLAAEFDRPGDWRIKVGGCWDDTWEVFGASWTPTHWMPLPSAPVGGA